MIGIKYFGDSKINFNAKRKRLDMNIWKRNPQWSQDKEFEARKEKVLRKVFTYLKHLKTMIKSIIF